MLIQFSVENFMSIREKAVLSMKAGKGNEHLENISKINNQRILKTVSIYGANASGKTNIFRAMCAAINTIKGSNTMQINEKMLLMNPFKFDETSKNNPCKFEFIFVQEGIKYAYGFSADQEKIHEEYLYTYLSSKPTRIFERNGEKYEFNESEKKTLSEISERNTSNKLFISTATMWNYERTKQPFLWFIQKMDVINNLREIIGVALPKFENNDDGKLKEFTLNLLKNADINLSDYNVDVKETDLSQLNVNRDAVLDALLKNRKLNQKVEIIATHNIMVKERAVPYTLDMQEESDGTNSIFFLSPIIKNTLENGGVLVIDEINKSLHPELVKYITTIFHNPDINKNNAQLIFNTHDVSLLSTEVFRRDQIYFAEKDSEKGTTQLYSLDEFSVRKKENVRKGYLNGRYGAIPFINDGGSLWE